MAVTLLEVRTRIRQRSGNEHTQDFVADTELNQLINTRYQELYGLLQRHGLHRASTPFSIAADGSATYPMPADFFAILAVFRIDSGEYVYLERHDHRRKPNQNTRAPASSYRMIGANIEFDPTPSEGDYHVVYLPVPATLVNDADTLDGVLGWEEYLVVGVSIDVGIKDKVDVRDLRDELYRLELRIIDEAKAAEMSENPTVQNVRLPRGSLPGGNRGVQGYWGSPYWLFRSW